MSPNPLPDAVESKSLDIQHDTDPERDHGLARRIPHLGHALLFFSLSWMVVSVSALAIFSLAHLHQDAIAQHPGFLLLAQALAYVVILAISYWLFPHLWVVSFLQGIHWGSLAARRKWYWIAAGGVLLSAAAQSCLYLLPQPKTTPFDQLLSTPSSGWILVAFAVLLAPVTEEIAFRGFLLPALATAYDWLSLERSPAALDRWERSTEHSTSALVFAAIFSSVPFVLLHADQLSHAWGILGVLYGVSLALSFVRIRTHSVACSTLLHATYNLTIFVVTLVSTGGFRHLSR